jgi:hypothetical protein
MGVIRSRGLRSLRRIGIWSEYLTYSALLAGGAQVVTHGFLPTHLAAEIITGDEHAQSSYQSDHHLTITLTPGINSVLANEQKMTLLSNDRVLSSSLAPYNFS